MKTLFTTITIAMIALTANTSLAVFVQNGSEGPLTLDVTDPDEAFIVNTSDMEVEFIGYSIDSASGSLNPAGFLGIGERFWADPRTWGPILGWGAGGMGKAHPTEYCLAELTMGMPLTFPAGYRLSIGNACPNGSPADLDFNCVYVPEPATMSLLALGGLAVARRRRH